MLNWARVRSRAERAEAADAEDYTYSFRVGVPDVRLFPFETWRRLVSRELRLSALKTATYSDAAGHAGLRQAIARHLAVSRGVHASSSAVTITAGTQQAIDLIARSLLEPGDLVAVEEPGYPPPHQLMRLLGMRVAPVRVDREGLVVAEIPDGTKLVYTTPAHQFPLGLPMSMSRRMELLAWAGQHDAAIIEDDYDSEFRFGGRPVETLHALDTRGRVCYVGTFSKTMLPAIRLGFIVAPASIQKTLEYAKYLADWHCPMVNQAALASFIDEGLFAGHIRKMRGEYERRHARILEVLAEQGDWVQPVTSLTGLHLTALLPPGQQLSPQTVWERSAGSQLAVNVLSQCYLGPPAQAGFILGYGAIALADIPDGLHLLRRLLAPG